MNDKLVFHDASEPAPVGLAIGWAAVAFAAAVLAAAPLWLALPAVTANAAVAISLARRRRARNEPSN